MHPEYERRNSLFRKVGVCALQLLSRLHASFRTNFGCTTLFFYDSEFTTLRVKIHFDGAEEKDSYCGR